MKAVVDVGHFHSVGVHWQTALDQLAGQVALVRIRDQVGVWPVPFGMGEIDLPRLFAHLRKTDYTGDVVIEMEVEDMENTLQYLAAAREYLRAYCL
jgi:sugar phosphate isomerase/epimerase